MPRPPEVLPPRARVGLARSQAAKTASDIARMDVCGVIASLTLYPLLFYRVAAERVGVEAERVGVRPCRNEKRGWQRSAATPVNTSREIATLLD